MQKVRNKRKVYLAVLIIVLLLVGVFFAVKIYNSSQQKKGMKIFEQGMQYGYAQAILQVINISDSCKPFPIYVGNETRELVSVTCYKDQTPAI